MEVIVDTTKGVYKERIVRCKECKHWQKSREKSVMCCMRERPNRPMNDDDFCSYGEVRDE